jgi:hypothetical protein
MDGVPAHGNVRLIANAPREKGMKPLASVPNRTLERPAS